MGREQRPEPSAAGSVPPGLAERMAALRALYVPENRDEVRVRLAERRPSAKESFEKAVARRLRELHALYSLTRHLHRATFPNRPGA